MLFPDSLNCVDDPKDDNTEQDDQIRSDHKSLPFYRENACLDPR